MGLKSWSRTPVLLQWRNRMQCSQTLCVHFNWYLCPVTFVGGPKRAHTQVLTEVCTAPGISVPVHLYTVCRVYAEVLTCLMPSCILYKA